MPTPSWLDLHRDHVVTCLQYVGLSQLADLLGISHNSLYSWVKTRDVGPIMDSRGHKRIPNLEKGKLRPAAPGQDAGPGAPTPPQGAGDVGAVTVATKTVLPASPVANMPENVPERLPTEPRAWPDLDLALQRGYHEIHARLSPEAIDTLRCRLKEELAKAYDSRRDALLALQASLPTDFLRLVEGGALLFMTKPIRVIGGDGERRDGSLGSEMRLLICGWDSWNVQITTTLPDGTYRFLVLAIPQAPEAPA
jgi:hypothetical protein